MRRTYSRPGPWCNREPEIVALALLAAARARLSVVVHLCPPDRRKRDLDNAMKCLLDSLQHAGVYADDGQIDRLDIRRGKVMPGGKVLVCIREKPCTGAGTTDCSKRK